MDYKTHDEIIREYNERVYNGEMPVHNMSVLRELLEKGDKENADREDNNNSPVEGWHEEKLTDY